MYLTLYVFVGRFFFFSFLKVSDRSHAHCAVTRYLQFNTAIFLNGFPAAITL